MAYYLDEMVPIPSFQYSLDIGEPQEYLDEDSELQSLMAHRSGPQEFNPGGQMQMPTGRTLEVPNSQPQQKPRGNAQKILSMLPVFADAAAAAVATPNRAFGGAPDVAAAFLNGRGMVDMHRQRAIQDQAWQQEQARRDMEVQAELAYRQKQIQAAEAQRQRAEQAQQQSPWVVAGNGVMLNRVTGEVKQIAPPGQKPKIPWAERPWAERDAEAVRLGLLPDTYEYKAFMTTGTVGTRPPTPPTQRPPAPQRRTAEQVFLDPNASPAEKEQALRWKTAGRGGKGGGKNRTDGSEMTPTQVRAVERSAQRLHSERARLGAILSIQDGQEFASGQRVVRMTPDIRQTYQRRYEAATNQLRLLEAQLGRPQTEAGASAQPAAPAAPTAAAPTPPAPAPTRPVGKYVIGQGFVR